MPITSAKNSYTPGASAAISGLGLGDTLKTQVEDETEEQKRRRLLMQQMQQAVSPYGVAGALGLGGGYAGR